MVLVNVFELLVEPVELLMLFIESLLDALGDGSSENRSLNTALVDSGLTEGLSSFLLKCHNISAMFAANLNALPLLQLTLGADSEVRGGTADSWVVGFHFLLGL